MVLPDLPLGVVGFFVSETVPRSVPIVAVAYSSCVFMYRNMKLFYKYYLPSTELSMCEMEVWKQVIDYCLFVTHLGVTLLSTLMSN